MNRSRFIQGLKGDIQLSEKERKRIIRKSLQKYSWKTKCTVAMEEFSLQKKIGFMRGKKMMGRAERRRTQKLEQKAKTATYNLTKEQLNIAVREQVGKELERIKQEATDDAVNTAMVLLLTLPLEVLMDHYWTKTYAKRIPRFTELVLEYYERWQNGELDMDKLKEDLWEYGGVKLVEGEGETA